MIGIGGFIGTIAFAEMLKTRDAQVARTIGVTAIILGAVFMVVFTTPLGYFVAMRRSQRSRGLRSDGTSPALRALAAPAGRLLFELSTRSVAKQPPRNAAAALDALLAEVEAQASTAERATVRGVRDRLHALQVESESLRGRERQIDRAIAEAGAGAAAEQLTAARAEIGPQLERIAATIDAARLKLLLVRSGVAPSRDLGELVPRPEQRT
jgi:hypothetical protein